MTAEIRELLELAAQAAGIDYVWDDTTSRLIPLVDGYPQHHWNPRESSDDLIDLMVKLSIGVQWVDSMGVVQAHNFLCGISVTEKLPSHPNRKAALAMAVVRCAAEYQRRKGC